MQEGEFKETGRCDEMWVWTLGLPVIENEN